LPCGGAAKYGRVTNLESIRKVEKMEMASGSSAAAAGNSANNLKRSRPESPENVVVILPDESCFEYAQPETKKSRAEGEFSISLFRGELFVLICAHFARCVRQFSTKTD